MRERRYFSEGEEIQLKSDSRYVIESVIGQGSSAVTYRATKILQNKYNLSVLLKHFNPKKQQGTDNEQQKNDFMRAIEFQVEFNRSNAVSCMTEVFIDDNQGIIVELYDPNTIVLTDVRLENINELFSLFEHLAAMVEEFHKNGYVLFDLKPENIVVFDKKGSCEGAFYIDFDSVQNIAKIQFDQISSTLEFSAPELLQFDALYKPEKPEDFLSCDIYNLGVMLYIALFGVEVSAFNRKDTTYRFSKDMKPIFSMPDYIEEPAKKLMAHMLCLDPSARYTIEHVREELKNLRITTYNEAEETSKFISRRAEEAKKKTIFVNNKRQIGRGKYNFTKTPDLQEIVGMENVESIGDFAFQASNLERFESGEALREIGVAAFGQIKTFQKVILGKYRPLKVGIQAFQDCRIDNLTLYFDNLIFGERVFWPKTVIGRVDLIGQDDNKLMDALYELRQAAFVGDIYHNGQLIKKGNRLFTLKDNILLPFENYETENTSMEVYLNRSQDCINRAQLYYGHTKHLVRLHNISHLKRIEDFGLQGTELREFVTPMSMTFIGVAAFGRCRDLKRVILGYDHSKEQEAFRNIVTQVADNAFQSAVINELIINADDVTLGTNVFIHAKINLVRIYTAKDEAKQHLLEELLNPRVAVGDIYINDQHFKRGGK